VYFIPAKVAKARHPPLADSPESPYLGGVERKHWFWLLIALALPALLINLGRMVFIDDEGIRALVALEMIWRDNFWVPTLHGDPYLNKPPLWNWILAASFQLWGRVDEWTARLPTVLCLLGYAATIYRGCRKHLGQWDAFLAAAIFVTCGRVLFWDSMLALIDLAFSWCIFTLFLVVYHYSQARRWWPLFLLSYLLTAVAFLFKGLPALAFQAITLLVWLSWRGDFRRLFHPAHFAGIGLLLLITGGYGWAYAQYGGAVTDLLGRFFVESSKRTVVQYAWSDTLIHLVSFPFEMIYHFLPWTLMIGYLLRRDILTWLRSDPFITFCLLTFLANILLYWSSPEVYPRYLLMLAPLIFIVYLWLHRRHETYQTWQYRTLFVVFGVLGSLAAVVALLPPFLSATRELPLVGWKSGGLFVAMAALSYRYWTRRSDRLAAFIALLLCLRIGFDWFVLPPRAAGDERGQLLRTTAIDIGERYRNDSLTVFGWSIMEPASSFYLERAYGGIVPRHVHHFRPDRPYISNPKQYPDLAQEVRDSLYFRHEQTYYRIGPLLDPATADPTLAQPLDRADYMTVD
jgi:4-amino-4-deoxy-L-arabinose transferase-like glycosyltransferase